MEKLITYVGLDVHKETISVAFAQGGDRGDACYIGKIANSAGALSKLARKLSQEGRRLRFCYEAGPCGYAIHRHLTGLGHDCVVVAPSLIPRRPGDRVKTDRRDCLAKLDRAGALTAVWVPDVAHEAMRDLVRARAAAARALRRARQQLSGFLLRHARVRSGKNWTRAHRRWLAEQRFEQPAQRIVLEDYIQAVEEAQARCERLTTQIDALVASWSMAPLVKALQALRGVALVTAVTLVAELGDLTRFESPRQLMAHLGLVPSENSSARRVRRGGITKAGNGEARRVLIEAAWCYRFPARVSRCLLERSSGLPKALRDIAWKGQLRLPLPPAARPRQGHPRGGRRHRPRAARLHLGHGASRRPGEDGLRTAPPRPTKIKGEVSSNNSLPALMPGSGTAVRGTLEETKRGQAFPHSLLD